MGVLNYSLNYNRHQQRLIPERVPSSIPHPSMGVRDSTHPADSRVRYVICNEMVRGEEDGPCASRHFDNHQLTAAATNV